LGFGPNKEIAMSAGQAPAVTSDKSVRRVKMNLEIQIVPVSDADRSKEFYEGLGWRLDDDVAPFDGLRTVQIHTTRLGVIDHLRRGAHNGRAGLGRGWLVVSDTEAAHDDLLSLGIEVSDVWHGPPFPVGAHQPGPDPERTSYGSFFSFNDPDGNLWIVQEVTTRLRGRE
jgi:catechol 2,3-dioxygenase-like lactoylglutathione lyase family enzyme